VTLERDGGGVVPLECVGVDGRPLAITPRRLCLYPTACNTLSSASIKRAFWPALPTVMRRNSGRS